MIAKLTSITATTLLLLTACGSETSAPAPENPQESGAPAETVEETETAAVTATPPGFAQCRACHTVEKGGNNGVGPNLWGVAGQTAAHTAGFNYSPAMKASSFTWDTATLDKFLKEPMKTLPGTKMAYAGLRNDEQRAEVIAFLETLKD